MMVNYWSLVAPIADAVSIYDGPEVFLSQFNACIPAPRTLLAAHWTFVEICNGGLLQFFANSTGVLAPEAVAAFRTIGMPRIAAVISEAISWFGPHYPRERHLRQEQLADYQVEHPNERSPFEPLDDMFYRLIESENGGFVTVANAFANCEAI